MHRYIGINEGNIYFMDKCKCGIIAKLLAIVQDGVALTHKLMEPWWPYFSNHILFFTHLTVFLGIQTQIMS